MQVMKCRLSIVGIKIHLLRNCLRLYTHHMDYGTCSYERRHLSSVEKRGVQEKSVKAFHSIDEYMVVLPKLRFHMAIHRGDCSVFPTARCLSYRDIGFMRKTLPTSIIWFGREEL